MCGRLSKSKRVTAAPPHCSYDPKKSRGRGTNVDAEGAQRNEIKKGARQVEEMV
jgi:hypothetical protein